MCTQQRNSDNISLVRAVARGDTDAFAALAREHQRSIFRFARGLTNDDAAAEDVLQETLLGAFSSAGSFRGESTVRTWLLGIAYRQASKLHRRRSGQPGQFEPLPDLGVAAGWGAEDTPELLVTKSRLRECLSQALDSLEPAARAILILRDLEDMPGAQTAEILGIGITAMKSRLHRARLKLAAAVRLARCIDGA